MKIVFVFDWRALTDDSTDLEFFAAKKFGVCDEAHLKFIVLIDLEEFAEALLEDRVAERVRHDIVAAGHFEARLHFDDTDLIQCRNKEI